MKRPFCPRSYCSSCHKSTEEVRTNRHSKRKLYIILYHDVFMIQLKFYNYHVKRFEIWLVLPTARQQKSTVWTWISCQAFFWLMNSLGKRLMYVCTAHLLQFVSQTQLSYFTLSCSQHSCQFHHLLVNSTKVCCLMVYTLELGGGKGAQSKEYILYMHSLFWTKSGTFSLHECS